MLSKVSITTAVKTDNQHHFGCTSSPIQGEGCFVEGPLGNLQPSMIQFSRPKKTLQAAMDPFRRFETSASELFDKGKVPAPAPSRFDPSYYRHARSAQLCTGDAQSSCRRPSPRSLCPGQLGVGKGRTLHRLCFLVGRSSPLTRLLHTTRSHSSTKGQRHCAPSCDDPVRPPG